MLGLATNRHAGVYERRPSPGGAHDAEYDRRRPVQQIDPDADLSGATAVPILSAGLYEMTGPQHPQDPSRDMIVVGTPEESQHGPGGKEQRQPPPATNHQGNGGSSLPLRCSHRCPFDRRERSRASPMTAATNVRPA
jgi:hypothetical protein